MEDELLKITFAIIAAVLYFLFKSQSKEKKADAPEKLNSPVAQVQMQKQAKLKTVSFEDILKKFEDTTPAKVAPVVPPTQEVNISSPAQLRKLIKQKELKFDEENEDVTLASRKKRFKEIATNLKEINDNKKHTKEEEDHHKEKKRHKEKEENKSWLKETQKEKPNNELIKTLKNPETAKHAFILGEIFNKKTW